jgi:hypothetical protein
MARPAEFAHDAQFKVCFEREAKTISLRRSSSKAASAASFATTMSDPTTGDYEEKR